MLPRRRVDLGREVPGVGQDHAVLQQTEIGGLSTASGWVVLRFPVETSLAPPSRNVSRSATVLASR